MAVQDSQVTNQLEREESLIAAARHIMRVLGSNKKLTSDAKKILADLGSQLSSMTKPSDMEQEEEEGVNSIEDRINAIEEKILKWEEDQYTFWNSRPGEASEYLNAADEARRLIESLERLQLNKEDQEYKFLLRAHYVLQTAMARLEEQFKNLIFQNQLSFEHDYVSFWSGDESSIVSLGDESIEELHQRSSASRPSEEHTIDLVRPGVIPELRCIAKLMFASNYDQECSQAYTTVRREALDECLYILDMERPSIEDVLRMDWGTLNSKIKRWVWAVKIFVRVYLASEKWLSDQIFGEGEPISIVCFVDASKTSILQLLNFSEAMSIGPHQPEKLFRILDMYEVLADLMPDLNALYPDEVGSSVRTECHEVLKRLGDCVRATFIEFENAIASNASSTPFVGGGIHLLTRYVMNYIMTLTEYSKTLNLVLKDADAEEDSKSQGSAGRLSSTVFHFRSVASILECNLEEKSKLYREAPLQHLFLMNNVHYMAEKVKGSELRLIYGDEWIRRHSWKFQQHAMNYERASWSSILSLLKDEGIQTPGTTSISRNLLKERLRSFYLAFEDVYRIQTAWLIPDVQLREDLHISISLKVIQAYRTFVGRHSAHISDKHIKYNADDLEKFLFDFFEGSTKSLQNPHKR
ncbi:hypothetical protein L6164_006717 [Bauhinia variegata]|uniref:Uncharacterized protein n=1 Tax=Bauhinia variegata TaxID=167791 RepID=A0ACB9PUS0_BAUVA|nr:hypothetical protein L6164_006717 [Bauhinia variegata]